MMVCERSEMADSRKGQPVDFSLEIASLRESGADRFDPVRLHYLEVLAKRASAHEGRVQHILGEKLAKALVVFRAQFEQAHGEARDSMALVAPKFPQAVADLQRLLESGDFRGVTRCITALERRGLRESLGDLTLYIEQHSPDASEGRLEVNAGSRTELKSVRYFRNTWSKLSSDKQVTQALDQAPKHAGPMNSHMLVLRSLALMRDISPDYLNRFMSYVDTLLCLDQGGKVKPAKVKVVVGGDGGKKTKSPRSRTKR